MVGTRSRFRDPQPLGRVTRDLAKKRGWSARVAEGTVLGQWPSVVGSRSPTTPRRPRLRDGVLSVIAESTAWATQLRMIQAQLLGQDRCGGRRRGGDFAEDHRPGRPVVAQGPSPYRRRGPRDTYGAPHRHRRSPQDPYQQTAESRQDERSSPTHVMTAWMRNRAHGAVG